MMSACLLVFVCIRFLYLPYTLEHILIACCLCLANVVDDDERCPCTDPFGAPACDFEFADICVCVQFKLNFKQLENIRG